ncbi:MAG: PIN domain-containing protein [Acidimicrobiia bacterium]|nr:PIN domain-containing protein [Acidimicrobiia bacterium]
MTLVLDTSALVRRYVHAPGRDLVLGTMADDGDWCASALAPTETLVLLHRLALHPAEQEALWRAAREDFEALWVVPVDGRCLARATEIAATYGTRTIDAVHLAAADRLPRPLRYCTFDRRQIPAAAGLGFEVITPLMAD